MITDTDTFNYETLPQYLDQTQQILNKLRTLNYSSAKKLWKCSDKIARPNFEQLQKLDLHHHLTPALLAFNGIQYQYMSPDLFTEPALDYVRQNLRILSGFYGILRPFDGIVPYRLEMQSKVSVNNSNNLYDFWKDLIYSALITGSEPIVNLASQEYAKAITPYLLPNQKFITVIFGSLVDGKIRTKATLAKMARGEMVRYMAESNITRINDIKKFRHPDWKLLTELSTTEQIVFVYQR